MRTPNPFFGLCLGLWPFLFDLGIISAEVIHEHITVDVSPGQTVKPLHIAITETVEAVAEMSMTMSKSLAETVMAEPSVCAKLTIIMNSSAAPTTSLSQITSALAQVAAEGASNPPPTTAATNHNMNTTANSAQPTAVAAVASSLSLSPSSSPCVCECICPSAGFQMSPRPPAVVATPEVQTSLPENMIPSTNAGQSSLQSMAVQPAVTSTTVAQQANLASTASSASSTSEIIAPAQSTGQGVESSGPPPATNIAAPTALSVNLSSSATTSMVSAFDINTYPLSSAVTAPVVLEK